MPLYKHACDNGHEFDLVLKFSELDDMQHCACGRPALRVICAPMVFVQQDVCYDSPVDGRPITNRQARIEDMKRNGCVEYDPGMKQDYERRIAESDRKLDQTVETMVEKEFAQMPSVKRERLTAELESGVSAEVARITPAQTSART